MWGGTPYYNINTDTAIKYLDFMTKEELANVFCAADVFVLPTREDVWGLVVNEAMCYGCPVVTTDKCGAGLQMVEDGVNGYIFESENVSQLKHILQSFLSIEDTKPLEKAALATAHKYTVEEMAKRTSEIIEEFINSEHK